MTLSRGDHAHRLKPMANNGLRVAPYAQETPGPPGPEPGKAQHKDTGHARDPAPIHGIARAVEDRQLHIRPIGREAGRPNDCADAASDEVEGIGFLAGGPDRLIDGARRRVDSLGRDVPIDQRVDAVVHPVRLVEIGFEVRLENHPTVAHVIQAPIERHALLRKRPKIDVAPAVASSEVVIGVLSLAAYPLVGDRDLILTDVRQPVDDVAAAIEARASWRVAGDEVHLPAVEMQILGDLRLDWPAPTTMTAPGGKAAALRYSAE